MTNKLPNFKDAQGNILVPISEASKILGISVDTLRRWDEKGKITSKRPDGKNRYFSLADLENFKASKTFSIGEAGEYLGISSTTLRRLDESGILPAQRSGAERIYHLADLEEFSSSQYFQTKKNLDRLEHEVFKAPQIEVDSSDKERVDQIVRILNEDEAELNMLANWRARLVKTTVILGLICLIIVFGVTSSFLIAPIKTAHFMGFVDPNGNKLIASPNVSTAGSNSYDVLGATSNLEIAVEPKFEQPGAAQSLVRSALLPFTRVSLAIVDVVDHKKYEKVIPKNINEIFAFNKKNELIPLISIDFATSGLFKISDKGLIKNLNADYLRGKVPGTGPGDLVYYDSKGEIPGTNNTYYVNEAFTGILPLVNGGTGANLALATNGGLIFLSGNRLNSTGPQNGVIVATGSGAFGSVAGTPNYLIKWNSSGNSLSSQSMIYDNGQVGIGNTDPGQALDVSGNIYARGGQIRIGNFAAPPGAIGAGSLYYDTGSNQVFYFNGTSWTAFGTGSGGGDSVWNTGVGVIYPNNLTVDALIGGTSTASAKFGFINVLAGTPSIQINGATVLSPTVLGSGVITSSLTSVGTLISGSIGSGFGTIETANTITGTTLNGTTGINSGAGAGTQRIDSSGNLVNIGTITSGLINGQTISSAANFTGSLTAVGPISFTTFNTNGGLLYTNGSGTLAQTSAGNMSECLMSSGGGAPTWGACAASAGANYWSISSGTIYPINSTLDLLIGGASTTSAKFAFIGSSNARGSQTASISGGLILDSSTNSVIQTTNNRTLSLNPNGGRVGIGTSNPRYALEVVGTRNSAEAISVKNNSNGNAASADMFVWNDIDAYTDFGMSSSTYTTIPALQNFGYFYTSGNANGFAIWNEGADPITFTVNNSEAGRFDTTGQFNIGGDSTPNSLFTVGSSSQFQVNSSGAIAAATGITSSGTITFSGFTGANNGGVIFANSSGVLSQTTAGTSAQCLLGGVTPTFGSCSAGGNDSPFQVLNGAIVPINSTLDFLVGGQATTSADFAFIRVNSGTPTASISAGTAGNNTFLTGGGNLGTTNGRTLTFGGTSTGLIQVSNKAGSAFTTFDTVNSRLGLGTATPADTLDVSGTARILSGSNGSVQSLLTLRNNGGTSVGTGLAIDFYAGDTNIRGKLSGIVESGGPMALVFGNGVGSTTERFRIDKAGNVGIGASTPTSALYVTKPLSFTANGKALVTFDQIEQQDILTASASGTPVFTITRSGGIALGTNGLSFGTSSQCLLGGSTATWGSCGTGLSTNWWTTSSDGKALAPINSTMDFLLGSQATTSAKFAVLNLNGSGPATASVSGNFIIQPQNGAGGRLGIGTNTPTSEIDVIKNWNSGTNAYLTNSSNGTSAYAEFGASNGTGFAEFGIGGTGYTDLPLLQNRAYTYANSSTDGLVLYTSGTADPILFATDDIERLILTGSGLLGVGTSSPISELHVSRALSQGATGKALVIFDQIENQDILTASKSGVSQFIVDGSGNVGLEGNFYDITGATVGVNDNLDVSGSLAVGTGDAFQVNTSGAITTATGITSSGTINFSGLSASSAVYTDGSKNLTTTAPTTGTIGYWSRSAQGTLTPATTNDIVAATSSAYNPFTATTNNPAGTLTNNSLIQHVAGGSVTNLLTLSRTAGTVTNGLTFSGTFTNIISSSNFSVSNAGAITAATSTNTINNLIISSGALSGITGYTQSSGAFAFSGGGNFSVTSAGLNVSTGGSLTGVSGITSSGSYTQSGSSTNTFTGATTISSAASVALALSGAATTAINISSTGVTTDISLQNNETISNNTDGLVQFTGAVGSDFNFNGSSTTFPGAAGGFTLGWNYSSGGGEVDLITRQGAGSTGGFRIYDWDGATATQIMDLTGAGNVSFPGYITTVESIQFEGSIDWVIGQDSVGQAANCTQGTGGVLCFGTVGGGPKMSLSNSGQLVLNSNVVTNGSPDVAENIQVIDQSIEAADILAATGYDEDNSDVYDRAIGSSSSSEYQASVIGVVSTNAGMLLNARKIFGVGDDSNQRALAIAGRTPIKVSNINGIIKAGDPVTSSSISKFGMKATRAGTIVGKALEDFDPASGKGTIIPCPAGTDPTIICGKILAFLNVSWYDPDVYLTNTGNINITLDSEAKLAIIKKGDELIKRNGAYNEGVFGKLRAGIIEVTTITTNSLNIKSDEVRIGDKKLSEYIDSRITTNGGISGVTEAKIAALQSQVDSLNSVLGVATSSAEINLLASQINDTQSQIDAINATQSAATDSGTGNFNKLNVSGNTLIEGILTVIDPLKAQDIIVTGTANFFGDVIIKGKTRFDGNVQFAANSAGIITINQGSKKVKVTFTKKFDKEPLINTTMLVDGSDTDNQAILDAGYSVAVTDKSDSGFTIILNKPAESSLKFNWSAVQVSN